MPLSKELVRPAISWSIGLAAIAGSFLLPLTPLERVLLAFNGILIIAMF